MIMFHYMFRFTFFLFLIFIIGLLFRFILYRTALIYVVKGWVHWVEDRIHVHQYFKVPELNENNQVNQFYQKAFGYVNSLASVEDSDFTNLFVGRKWNDIMLCLDDNQVVYDKFLGARVSWTNEVGKNENSCRRSLVLRIKKKDKRRILRPYIQHIHMVSDDVEQRGREIKLFVNTKFDRLGTGRWRCVPFTHPSTFDTMAMDADLKSKVKYDLETYLKSKQYYHRLGRVWKRSYLLYGPSGTGKSSFAAAMAKFLHYDVYDIDLTRVSDDSDLKMLMLQTTSKSVILLEDLDRFIIEKSTAVSLAGMLNFMDGIVNSCCGDEKIMVCTMNNKEQMDEAILRAGRIDVQIYFPPCNFNSFKILANNYLGIKDHKLFPQVEEFFQRSATVSPAGIAEIMIVNRSSPSRAMKTVLSTLQTNGEARMIDRRQLRESSSSPKEANESGGGIPAMKEIRKFYSLIRSKSNLRSGSSDNDSGTNNR